tara:strand:+ start:42 stop:479 length:438 start_codon:yes stop_codon:yes gene_type:complete
MNTPFFLIEPDDIQDVWPGARPLVEKALEHAEGGLTSSDVLRLVLNGRQQLWVGFEDNNLFTAIITEIIVYPRHNVLRIITFSTLTGHGMDRWYDGIMDKLESFAKASNCTGIEAWCRKGLSRKLDWDHTYSVVFKSIKQGKENE